MKQETKHLKARVKRLEDWPSALYVQNPHLNELAQKSVGSAAWKTKYLKCSMNHKFFHLCGKFSKVYTYKPSLFGVQLEVFVENVIILIDEMDK